MVTLKAWREAVENPPKCCLSCRHYPADAWAADIDCIEYKSPPPREWAEEINECEAHDWLVPF
jgi:hypothetical protein